MVPRPGCTAFFRMLFLVVSLVVAASGCGDKPREGEGGDGGGDDEDLVAQLPFVPGLQNAGLGMTAIELYQGVQIPIMSAGESVLDSDVPIVAGKDAVLRVYVELAEGFEPRTVWLRAELTNSAGMTHIEEENEVTVNSTAGSISSTLNLKIPGTELEAGQAISVSIHETSEDANGSGSDDGAIWPTSGEQDLGMTEAMPPMKLVLVPVEYNADGSGRLPDTGPAQMQLYKDLFYALYPVAGLEITVAEPMPYGAAVSGMNVNSWSNLLNAVTALRTADGAGPDEFYYGLVVPEDSFGEFCGGGCITGMSWQPEGPGSGQAGTGIGFTGMDSVNTSVHEVGHSAGLGHAPCGGPTGVDPGFPYDGGGIGVMGYDVTKEYGESPLKDPATFKDLMGYCPNIWISDYNFDLLFYRMEQINQSLGASISPPPGGDTTWLSISIAPDGAVSAGPPLRSVLPIEGEPRRVELLDATGAIVGEAEGVFVPRADFGGGLVAFRQPLPGVAAARVAGYPAVALR